MDDLLIGAVAPAAVGGLLKALDADGGHEVAHFQHLVGKGLVDQGAVGEGQEHAVVVLAADLDEVFFAHQRFAARVDVEVHAHFLALSDDGVDLVKAQVQLVAVLRRPAAGAVQVARGGGIQQDDPGDVAVVLLAVFLLDGPAQNVGVEDEVGEEGLQLIPVHIVEQVQDELVHVVGGVLHHGAHRCPLAFKAVRASTGQFVHPVHQLGHVLLRVLFQITQRRFQRNFFDRLVFHGKNPPCPIARPALFGWFLFTLSVWNFDRNGQKQGHAENRHICCSLSDFRTEMAAPPVF